MDTSLGPLKKPHVLVLPLPMQSHINVMFNFSLQLAACGDFIITFLNTDKAHQRMVEASDRSAGDSINGSFDIRFAVIPHGSQEPLPGTQQHNSPTSDVVALGKGMESQQEVIEEMVLTSRTTPHPITCIISDSTLSWTRTLSAKLGIGRVMFCSTNGTVLATCVEVKSGKLKLTDSENCDISAATNEHLTAGVPIRQSDFLAAFPKCEPERLRQFIDKLNGLEGTTCIVVNTCKELEGNSHEIVAKCGTKVHYVGPIMPLSKNNFNLSMNFYREESNCIEWLDKQVPRSVLYVSFGSVVSLSPHELEELAYGIEGSNQAFLWVSRDGNQNFPNGFLDRTSNRVLVVNWAPQIQVLKHVAIGGFLTHCGWNSTLESIHMGVPLLCYPMSSDQHINALLITSVWKIGISLLEGRRKDELRRDVVQAGVSTILQSQELHVQSTTWKSVVQNALEKGGSSYLALGEAIDDIVRSIARS